MLAVGAGSATHKAVWGDWGGDVQSIRIDRCVKSSLQVGEQIQPLFFLPLRCLETETLWV